MSERRNSCVLVATMRADDRLVARLGATEAAHAAERCRNRIERAIDAHGGSVLSRQAEQIVVGFDQCDAAVLAASDMLERVHALPPLSGMRQPLRIGLHYGGVEPAPPYGEAAKVAHQLACLSEPERALASGTAVMLLTRAARHAAAAQALRGPAFDKLDWPVFAVGQRSGMITSIPPMSRLSQRLRLRHQQDVVFIDELRPVLLLGRELGNDIVIMDPRASRQHARIERRPEGFLLIDESTNGTFVAIEGAGERCVRQDKMLLRGPGRLGCGFSASEIERDLVFFDIA